MYRILFFGTSDFAVPSLRALAADGRFEIVGVVTQPDRAVGRHAVTTPPPVKTAALGLRPPIVQPEKLKDDTFRSWIEQIGPDCDAFVVVSYGKILPPWLLALPKHGVVNVHGSLLPHWRGASPIQAAIAAGDAASGVTIMQMDELLDHGPVLTLREEPILATDTGGSLHDRLKDIGAELLMETLPGYLDGSVIPHEQDHDNATTCGILTRDDGRIAWTDDADAIERTVRAYTPWPGTWTTWNEKRLKIMSAAIGPETDLAAGTTFICDGVPCIACGHHSSLELRLVQLEGRQPISGTDFLRGENHWGMAASSVT